ncbi:MAG: hypothetical protein ACTSUE_22765 [Promethearchaeota archaeon]
MLRSHIDRGVQYLFSEIDQLNDSTLTAIDFASSNPKPNKSKQKMWNKGMEFINKYGDNVNLNLVIDMLFLTTHLVDMLPSSTSADQHNQKKLFQRLDNRAKLLNASWSLQTSTQVIMMRYIFQKLDIFKGNTKERDATFNFVFEKFEELPMDYIDFTYPIHSFDHLQPQFFKNRSARMVYGFVLYQGLEGRNKLLKSEDYINWDEIAKTRLSYATHQELVTQWDTADREQLDERFRQNVYYITHIVFVLSHYGERGVLDQKIIQKLGPELSFLECAIDTCKTTLDDPELVGEIVAALYSLQSTIQLGGFIHYLMEANETFESGRYNGMKYTFFDRYHSAYVIANALSIIYADL